MSAFVNALPTRIVFTIALWLAYAFGFRSLHTWLGTEALNLVLVPVMVSAFLLPVMWFVVTAVLIAASLNFVLLNQLSALLVTDFLAIQGVTNVLIWLLIAIGVAHFGRARRQQARLGQEFEPDALTGLLSRAGFEAKLTNALQLTAAMDLILAVVIIDLKRFKFINDSYGRDVGDQLLMKVSQYLAGSLRKGDLIGRVGGDEFIIALQGLTSSGAAGKVAKQLASLINEPMEIAGNTLQIQASVGISLYPNDAKTVKDLIRHAEGAMDEGKTTRSKAVVFSTQEMRVRRARMLELERSLASAIRHDELELRYQPQVNLATGQTSGFEVLLRWNSPKFGIVSPGEFIPLAEKTGEIITIGQWVIREACRKQQHWQQQGYPDLNVAVNVSAIEFAESDLVKYVHQTIQNNGIRAEHLEIEITESHLVHSFEKTAEVLHMLNQLHVKTALDDFGTGHSSLAYLQELPLKTIKIDRVFIKRLEDVEHPKHRDATVIVEAILAMAHKMRKEVVAEGIETAEQATFLSALGCSRGQGYYYGKPLTAVAVDAYLANEFASKAQFKTLSDTVDERLDDILKPR